MLGLWLENNQVVLKDDLPVPVPLKNEVLVKVIQAGICRTDLELIKGYYPFTGILGHEFVGQVEQGPRKLLGKRVVAEINIGCERCEDCKKGLSRHCRHRDVCGIVNKNGSFAQYLTLPISNVHLVPEQLSNTEACFTEPLAACLQVLEQFHIKPSFRVLVIGDGKLGQLMVKILALHACELYLVGHHPQNYLPYRDLGIVVGDEQLITDNDFDCVIECSGQASGFELALKAIKPKGTIVLKSTFKDKTTYDFSKLVVDEITLLGSRCGSFGSALRLLAKQKLNLNSLVEKEYPLSQAEDAIKHAHCQGTMKIMLNCQL